MIINEKIIIDIFNLKIKFKNEKDIIKLSKYEDFIPMYDIYSENIYPINKENIYYRLINCDYRFIDVHIYDWLLNKYKKYKKDEIKKILEIIKNYNIDILTDTSYKTLYKYSSNLGLSISICKKVSFSPYIKYFRPYYTKLELIKLGQNMKILKENEINTIDLLNKENHYNFCKKISSNDFSFKEIRSHTEFIIKLNIISYITFYSFYGSYLYNKYLREDKNFNNFLFDGMKNILKSTDKIPKLLNKYYVYRFIWDDIFLKDIKIGDYFIDKGFLSTTRDPFYSPGINGNFGLILIKIYIPETVKGLLIENFSLFPKEQEFLLPPNCKLKLTSKDDNFKYYHINETFEKLITKKYEFEYINYTTLNKINIKNNFKIIDDLKKYDIHGENRIIMFKNFISESSQIIININNKKYLSICMFYDSSEQSSYSRLYYNKIKDGLLISIYDNGYPYLNIEFGKEMIINYLNQFYFYNDTKIELNEEIMDIVLEFGRIFFYKEAKIYHNFRNFNEFKNNNNNNLIFTYMNFYNHTIYDYAKNKNKYLNFNFIKNKTGWYKLDEILNSELSETIINKYKLNNNKTIKDALIYIIENNFIIYDKILNDINKEYKINEDNYLIYEIYEKLNSQNRIDNFKSNIDYDDEENLGDDFKLIFRQPIRRY